MAAKGTGLIEADGAASQNLLPARRKGHVKGVFVTLLWADVWIA
jgi:hypothetical protein